DSATAGFVLWSIFCGEMRTHDVPCAIVSALSTRHATCSRRRYNEPMSGSNRMSPASPGVKLTYDDYLLFPDDGNRHELIDGEHYVTPLPRLSHQAISGNFHLLIGSWLEAHPIGRIYYAPVG